jgi:hypothetical protein
VDHCEGGFLSDGMPVGGATGAHVGEADLVHGGEVGGEGFGLAFGLVLGLSLGPASTMMKTKPTAISTAFIQFAPRT